jgi:hypothetical protein
MKAWRYPLACTVFAALAWTEGVAQAQVTLEQRENWNAASNVLSLTALGVVTLMPRVFTSDPEVTTGWKARWHVSVLAPSMTIAAAALINEVEIKGDCTSPYSRFCRSTEFMSTPSFVGGAALGQGIGTFLVDTLRWSHGSVNPGSLVGNVAVPLILAPIVAAGRSARDFDKPGQEGNEWFSLLTGLGSGFVMGLVYAELQRPECGYTGNLICW